MGILQGIERTGRSVTFIWVPSHVGITLNERVDDIAKQATCRDSVDIQGTLSMRQVKTQIRDIQNDTDKTRMENKYANLRSWHTYTNVALQTHFSYGKHRTNGKTQSSRDLMIYPYTYREQLEVHYSIPVLLPSLFSRTYTSPFRIEVTGYSDEACSVPNSKCRTDIRRRPTLPLDSVVAAKLFLKAASAAASLVPVEVGGLNVAVTVGLVALPPVQATHVVQRHHVSCGSNKRQSA
ncbi:hypothetical protein GWK47_010390 [Chionoecetes opilio]|uniref:RNase H type-1 domain-containing protein n=1 Tax=Chionoecetes opilio TaxID=41210 RepID=A0A8J5CN63_CHIOP|nr:hypothetical protein GWK47_010390 [Chionoecetes opilio]